MKKSVKWISTLACLSLIVSACGDGGGSSKKPATNNPTQTTTNNIPVQPEDIVVQNLDVEIRPEHKSFVEVISLMEAKDRGIELSLQGNEVGIIVIKPNSYVKYVEGNTTAEKVIASSSNALSDSAYEIYQPKIKIVHAEALDPNAPAPSQVVGNVDEMGFVIVDNSTQEEVEERINPQTQRSNTNEPDEDLIVYDNQTNNSGQPSMGNASPTPSQTTGQGNSQMGNTNTTQTPAPMPVVIPLYQKIGSLPESEALKLNCGPNAEQIQAEILGKHSARTITANENMLRALQCIARANPPAVLTRLFNAIVTNYNDKSSLEIIEAINSPALALILIRSNGQEELGLNVLRAVNQYKYHNRTKDMNVASEYMHRFERADYFEDDTTEEIYKILAEKNSSYTRKSDKVAALKPLARLLRLAGNDTSKLKNFYKAVLQANTGSRVKQSRIEYLRSVFLASAVLLAEKDCKVYMLTNKQQSVLQNFLGTNKYNDFLDALEEKKPVRYKINPNVASDEKCDLLDPK